MSIFSDLVGSFEQAVSTVTRTASDIVNGMADSVSGTQEASIIRRYSALQRALTVLWMQTGTLNAVQLQLVSLGNEGPSAATGSIDQNLSAIATELAQHIASPDTDANLAKIFPGGLSYFLRGKELDQQNQILDHAFQIVTQNQKQVANIYSYFSNAYENLFDKLVARSGPLEGPVASSKSLFLALLEGYVTLNSNPTAAAMAEVQGDFDSLNSQWSQAVATLALQMLRINAATEVAKSNAESAEKLKQLGVEPALVNQIMGV